MRWLLVPAEWRELKRIDSPAAAVNFIESFWRLRDPDPATAENELREQFAARVEAADQLYGEGEVRGSLTDRGRALILLGPPPHMSLTSEEALAWKPGRRSRQRATTREVRLEIWRYQEDELPAKMVRVLRAADLEPSVELKFRLGRRGAQLAEGENALILVSRLALVRE
ncbi:MAG: GWxTD domain-containing protein [Acidobacteriota bacterium]|nr:GWxTD domain-containing protein [Acidobacteriota bacterium]MDH3522767.1 GWxTD domain-containing protein [Acidobacteriota bacterium]